MKLVLRLIVLLVFFGLTVSAQQLKDGFYALTKDESGLLVRDQQGKPHLLGKFRPLKVIQAFVSSSNNQNDEFHFAVEVSATSEDDLGKNWSVFVYKGIVYDARGGAFGSRTVTLSFPVYGAENAEAVAQYFEIKIPYRYHPGHKLLVTFTPEHDMYRVGDEVKVKFRIKNIGNVTIVFSDGWQNIAPRNNQYKFTAEANYTQIRDVADSNSRGVTIKQQLTLKPGDVFEDTVDLSKWFAVDKPARYRIVGSYRLFLVDPEDTNRLIWADWATAEFEFGAN